MKVHWLQGYRTACGREAAKSTTRNPEQVTCQACIYAGYDVWREQRRAQRVATPLVERIFLTPELLARLAPPTRK